MQIKPSYLPFLLSLALSCLSLSSLGQVVYRNLIDCNQCIWAPRDAKIYQWQMDWHENFDTELSFPENFHSNTIGKIRVGSDTILKTHLVHNYTESGIHYWNGKKWKYRYLGDFDGTIVGIGAANFDFYYVTKYLGIYNIYHFNGYWSDLVHQTWSIRSADIAVDSLGRAWFPIGKEQGVADHFRIIDALGNIVREYPIEVPFSYNNVYGIAIENDVIYLGIGPNGEYYPSSILAFRIEDGKARLIEVMRQSDRELSYLDLASGNPGVPGRNPDEENPYGIYLYPNPTQGPFTVISAIPAKITVSVFDLQGRCVHLQTVSSGDVLDISNLATGTYLYRASVYGEVKSGKILKVD